MTQARPLVSIGMPTYQRAHLIGFAIDSLLRQDYAHFELIVSDNASTDATEELCRAYERRDPRVRYVRNERNVGMLPNFNRVFAEAKGELFVWAGDDDIYEIDFLSTLVPMIAGRDDVALATCSNDWIDNDGNPTTGREFPYFTEPAGSLVARARRALHHVRGMHFMGVYRTSVLRGTPLMQAVYRDALDNTDLMVLFDAALRGEILWTPRVLIHKRVGGSSGQPIHRPFRYNIGVMIGTGVHYDRRLRGAGIRGREKRAIRRSILARMLAIVWSNRTFLLKSLILSNVPARLRRAILDSSAERRRRAALRPS